MEMVSRPGERWLYGELLTLPGAPRADIAQMEQAVLSIMKTSGVQVLVIDEVHNILAGTYREQCIVLNTLCFLSNRLQISLVCFGVNETREAIGADVQLARRFEQFTLNRWATNEDFETLVTSILRNTPLSRPTVLTRNRFGAFCRLLMVLLPIFSKRSIPSQSMPSMMGLSVLSTMLWKHGCRRLTRK